MKKDGNYRGVGYSANKVCKGTGQPKRSGNFSYSTIHLQGLQSRDYPVKEENGRLIVGDHTPLAEVMGQEVATLALTDKFFQEYHQEGTKTVNGEKYEMHKTLTKNKFIRPISRSYKFRYRIMIYTDLDFNYNFPEY